MAISIKLGPWLKIRENYDSEMCEVSNWLCTQNRHYDAIVNGIKIEVKKTKTSGTIIKLQQLTEIMLDTQLPTAKIKAHFIANQHPSWSGTRGRADSFDRLRAGPS